LQHFKSYLCRKDKSTKTGRIILGIDPGTNTMVYWLINIKTKQMKPRMLMSLNFWVMQFLFLLENE